MATRLGFGVGLQVFVGLWRRLYYFLYFNSGQTPRFIQRASPMSRRNAASI